MCYTENHGRHDDDSSRVDAGDLIVQQIHGHAPKNGFLANPRRYANKSLSRLD